MERIEAIIFDFDGTLVDSEPNYCRSDSTLVAHFGGQMSEDEHDQYVGMGSLPFLELIKARYAVKESLDEMLALKDRLYLEEARKSTVVFSEMRLLLEALAKRKVPLAIASGSSKAVLNELTHTTAISSFFTTIVSSEEVELSKPAPDVFLETARRLGVRPGNCVVFEDSQYGVDAAIAAGMYCVAIPDIHEFLPASFCKAHLLFIGGMSSFTAARALEWLANLDRELSLSVTALI